MQVFMLLSASPNSGLTTTVGNNSYTFQFEFYAEGQQTHFPLRLLSPGLMVMWSYWDKERAQ